MTATGDSGATGAEHLTRRNFLRLGGAGAAVLATGTVSGALGRGLVTGTASAAVTPKRGGNLTVAVLGGSATDTLDADAEVNTADLERVTALYNGLVTYDFAASTVVNDLAEEFVPNSNATQWTIRVRSGVEFHNGK